MNGEREHFGDQERLMELEAKVRELETQNDALKAENQTLVKENTELVEQSYRDPLTGLYNRRFLDKKIESLFDTEGEQLVLDERRSNENKHEVGVIVVDADQFKKTNDTFGHAAGDAVLQSHSRALGIMNKREGEDCVIRTGGDEFVVLLEGMTEEKTAERAQNLRGIVRQFTVPSESGNIPATVSLGVGSLNRDEARAALRKEEIRLKGDGLPDDKIREALTQKKKEIFAAFLDRVDQAMYKAKKDKGRDQIARVSELDQQEVLIHEAA